MNKNIMRLAIISAPLLLLTACGENWEMQRTDQILPYGNQRTAGTGIAYMRAKMLPEKELKADIISEDTIKIEENDNDHIENNSEINSSSSLDAEKIFTKQQQKSLASKANNNITNTINNNEIMNSSDNNSTTEEKSTEKKDNEEKAAKAENTLNPSTDNVGDIKKETKDIITTTQLDAEEYIDAKPSNIEKEVVENIESELNMEIENIENDSDIDISELEPLAGDIDDDLYETEVNSDFFMDIDGFSSMETYENNVSQPSTQIIAPMQDFIIIEEINMDDNTYNSRFIEKL